MIEIRDLGKEYSREVVLDSIDLDIESGDFVAILGPSGCGKSTLLRLIANLEQPTKGSIRIGESDQGKGAAPSVAFVFQEPNLLPWRSARRNIGIQFELRRRKDRVNPAERVQECIELVGLSAQDAKKLPGQLSGGMKMRVSLARALVTHPQVMLMDEPFAALDDLLRQQLNEDVVRIWTHQRWTTLFVTHNVAEAVYLSRRILIMGRNPGSIIQQIDVPFGPDRPFELRSTPEFARVCGEISQALRSPDQ